MSGVQDESGCTYVPHSNEPCPTCTRLITRLYMCKFLQEGTLEDNLDGRNLFDEDDNEND